MQKTANPGPPNCVLVICSSTQATTQATCQLKTACKTTHATRHALCSHRILVILCELWFQTFRRPLRHGEPRGTAQLHRAREEAGRRGIRGARRWELSAQAAGGGWSRGLLRGLAQPTAGKPRQPYLLQLLQQRGFDLLNLLPLVLVGPGLQQNEGTSTGRRQDGRANPAAASLHSILCSRSGSGSSTAATPSLPSSPPAGAPGVGCSSGDTLERSTQGTSAVVARLPRFGRTARLRHGGTNGSISISISISNSSSSSGNGRRRQAQRQAAIGAAAGGGRCSGRRANPNPTCFQRPRACHGCFGVPPAAQHLQRRKQARVAQAAWHACCARGRACGGKLWLPQSTGTAHVQRTRRAPARGTTSYRFTPMSFDCNPSHLSDRKTPAHTAHALPVSRSPAWAGRSF